MCLSCNTTQTKKKKSVSVLVGAHSGVATLIQPSFQKSKNKNRDRGRGDGFCIDHLYFFFVADRFSDSLQKKQRQQTTIATTSHNCTTDNLLKK